MVFVELLPQLEFLRVLSLANYSITEVPQSIGSLKHLRYLNFSKTNIACLPEQIGDLYNLQSLLISSCVMLSSLPNSCVKLINLRHLDISDTPHLNKIPLGIGGLTSLQTLSKVIIGEANGFKISMLRGLLHLQGQLSIKGLHNVTHAIHAKEANLQQKKGLRDLEIEWSDVFDDSRNENIEYEVLEGLRPYDKLRSLKILFYMGMEFPSWVGDPSFVWLTQLTLRGCKSCTYLPTLGHLQSLQKLCVESMNGLKRLGFELLGPINSCHGIAFPSLQVLEFKDLQGWEAWSTIGADTNGTVGSFPCLRRISITDCPKLAVFALESIPSLQFLYIRGCAVVVLRNMVAVSPSIHRLTMANIKGLTQLNREVLEHLGAVEDLCIKECDELRYLWESKLEACKTLISLWVLKVESCQNLVSEAEKEVNLGVSLKSIRDVILYNCPRLESYNGPNSIEKLLISDCHSITFLSFPTEQDLPFTPKILDITSSSKLQMSWLLNNFLTSLESISLDNMPNLRSFPEGCLVHLTRLTICGCDNIEFIPDNGLGFLPRLCLTYIHITNCKNLRSFPHQHLQSLTCLEDLFISDCPSMDYTFPCGLWPPNLSTLVIGGLKKPMSEWGVQNFPDSLVKLCIGGKNSRLVSFANAEDAGNSSNDTSSSRLLLPSSLTFLQIRDFMDLESLLEGLQHLTCLEELVIQSCTKLKDLPETLLPLLSHLVVKSCPNLAKRCQNRKGNYWPIISPIPSLHVYD